MRGIGKIGSVKKMGGGKPPMGLPMAASAGMGLGGQPPMTPAMKKGGKVAKGAKKK